MILQIQHYQSLARRFMTYKQSLYKLGILALIQANLAKHL